MSHTNTSRLVWCHLPALALAAFGCGGSSATEAPSPRTVAAPTAEAQLHVETYTASEAGFLASSHLISGPTEAVLVDAQFTRSEAAKLVEVVRGANKRLTHIVITHAHPDHHLGLEVLRRAFPEARVVATAAVVSEIDAISPGKIAAWKPVYGDDLADVHVTPGVLDSSELRVDGAVLRIVELGAGESEHAAVVYLPAARGLVAGDLVYNHVHLWLAENKPEGWLANLDQARGLGPIEHVYPGHGPPGDATLLDDNAAYIRAFVDITGASTTVELAAAELKKRFASYGLPVIADYSAAARRPH